VPAGDGASSRGIAILGPPTSGKTTFLAALSIALIRQGPAWRVRGEDVASNNALIDLTTTLTKERAFPQATIGLQHYRWALDGRVSRMVPRRPFGRRLLEEDVRISLDVVDTPGELAAPDHRNPAMRDDLIETLTRSEAEHGDAFEHIFGVLLQVAQQMPASQHGRLPHHVAVCVTKFDEIRVFVTADKLGLVAYEPDVPGLPRVSDEDAREVFRRLCVLPGSGNAELLPHTIEQYFRPERLKYFVTSAIGFYVDPRTGHFDPDDFQNHVPDPTGPKGPRIRGPIYPINVVEPMLWLSDRLTREP
jgi:hypothetical protein